MFVMQFIRFRGLENIGIVTRTMIIKEFKPDLEKNVFVAAILNFCFLGGNRWRDSVVLAIFEISILKNPLVQIFMLLSGSSHQNHISALLVYNKI